MSITELIGTHFQTLNDPELVREMEENCRIMEAQAGEQIMDIGSYVKMMPLITKGALKVLREDDNGDELFLYFLYPGQSCAMTLQCCTVDSPSRVRAVAEEDTELIAIPIEMVEPWISKYDLWKNFILNTYSLRFNELLDTIDSIVFRKLDDRLMDYLQEKAQIKGGDFVHTTHQQIAYDLHSSREVISRLLKQFEKNGRIQLGRNKIELLD